MSNEKAGEWETVLRLQGISKHFGPLKANDDISLALQRGEILGLLGENGAGKTTLMNILFGHYVADQGLIEVEGKLLPSGDPQAALRAGVGMVHQHFALADNLSVIENIILGTESFWQLTSNAKAARQRIQQLGSDFGLGVDPDAMVATLSVGERQRVEILKALYRNVRILILDEPTAVLTPQESAALFETLKRFVAKGLSIIFISHKLNEILAACNRVAILRGGKLVAETDVTRTTRAQLAELMVGRAIAVAKAEPQVPGPLLLELNGVAAQRGTGRIHNINLQIASGEIIGIAGVSGNGQSLLADVVNGVLQPIAGRCMLLGRDDISISVQTMLNAGVARIPEDRHTEGLFGDMSITENVVSECYRGAAFSKFGFIDWQCAEGFAKGIIKDYEVKCSGPDAGVRLLSGGNMQKLILGRVMANDPALVIANQPTRGLDVGAVNYVHQQLLMARVRGAGVLLISEDLDELFAISDRIAVMYRGQLSQSFKRDAISLQQLGLLMAGQGFAAEGEADAA